MTGTVHISSLVVQCRPDRLSALRDEISAMEGAEVPVDDPAGKLVVVLETGHETNIATTLDMISRLDGVLSANLVYHQIDDEEEDPPGGKAGTNVRSHEERQE